MSGGSLNYLFCKDVEDLLGRVDDMEQAEEYLIKRGHDDVAKDVRRLIEYVKTAKNRIGVLHDQLGGVFHAVEWTIDGDYGVDDFEREIEKYRKGSEN